MVSSRSLSALLVLLAAVGSYRMARADRKIEDEAPSGQTIIAQMNNQLAARGLNLRIAKASFLGAPSSPDVGQTIFADDRTKTLDTQWVPGDPRRGGRNTITYIVDQSDGAANPSLTNAQTEAAIDRALATWAHTDCGGPIPIVKMADPGTDIDVTDGLLGFGTVGTPLIADIIDAGWMPPAFFDAVFPGGGTTLLASTFTYFFLDAPSGNDVNHDGKFDTAFAETYYNNGFAWAIDSAIPPVDVETVALHESGHGLSLDHYGKVFETDANGIRHFSPYAVMNALISQEQHTLTGTDISGLCTIWATWPR